MKKIFEVILAINFVVFFCIVFINIILRYGFQISILFVDELLRYLFVWLTFIGAIVVFMDNVYVQVIFLVEKFFFVWQRRVVLVIYFLILFICGVLVWGVTLKIIQDWSDYLSIFGLFIGLMYVVCLFISFVIVFFELRYLY